MRDGSRHSGRSPDEVVATLCEHAADSIAKDAMCSTKVLGKHDPSSECRRCVYRRDFEAALLYSLHLRSELFVASQVRQELLELQWNRRLPDSITSSSNILAVSQRYSFICVNKVGEGSGMMWWNVVRWQRTASDEKWYAVNRSGGIRCIQSNIEGFDAV